ncbi:hypothetical protein VZP55_35000 [Myxococcus faecalis]
MHARAARIRPGRLVPRREHLLLLGGREQRKPRELHVGRGDRLGEQNGEVARQALDGRRVEQVGVVVEDTRESGRALLDQQADVELRRLQLRRKLRERDAGERQRGARRVLQGEGDLEQGRAAQVTLRLQLLDELLERDVLVLVGGEGAQTHLS